MNSNIRNLNYFYFLVVSLSFFFILLLSLEVFISITCTSFLFICTDFVLMNCCFLTNRIVNLLGHVIWLDALTNTQGRKGYSALFARVQVEIDFSKLLLHEL